MSLFLFSFLLLSPQAFATSYVDPEFEESVLKADFIGVVKLIKDNEPGEFVVVDSWKGDAAGTKLRIRNLTLRLNPEDDIYVTFATRDEGERCQHDENCYLVDSMFGSLRISKNPAPAWGTYDQIDPSDPHPFGRFGSRAKNVEELKREVVGLIALPPAGIERALLTRLLAKTPELDSPGAERSWRDQVFTTPPLRGQNEIIRAAIESTDSCEDFVLKLLFLTKDFPDYPTPAGDRIWTVLNQYGRECTFASLQKFWRDESSAFVPNRIRETAASLQMREVPGARELPILWKKSTDLYGLREQRDSLHRLRAPRYLGLPEEELSVPDDCEFTGVALPNNARVFAAGAHEGRKLDWQIDNSGNEASQIDISVNMPGENIVLLLGAYNPTIWNVGITSGTKISAVILTGYHRQVLAGLPKNVPTMVSTYDNGGKCGYFHGGADTGMEAARLLSQKALGRRLNGLVNFEGDSLTIGDFVLDPKQLVRSTDISPESYFDRTAPKAGEAGIRALVEQGVLRAAKNSDIKAWLKAHRKKRALSAAKHRSEDIPAPENFHSTYVIMKNFTYPSGLYGAHSVNFILPAGVPKPSGNPGHCGLYKIEDGSCTGGSACPVEEMLVHFGKKLGHSSENPPAPFPEQGE